MTDEFQPHLPQKVDPGYRTDELTILYADAWEEGIWLKEFGAPEGSLTAAGSLYTLQEIEHNNPGLEINVAKLTLGDCVEISVPGSGPTREESVSNAIAEFKTSPLWEWHQKMHALAKERTGGD